MQIHQGLTDHADVFARQDECVCQPFYVTPLHLFHCGSMPKSLKFPLSYFGVIFQSKESTRSGGGFFTYDVRASLHLLTMREKKDLTLFFLHCSGDLFHKSRRAINFLFLDLTQS
jgi:hypothetical protein